MLTREPTAASQFGACDPTSNCTLLSNSKTTLVQLSRRTTTFDSPIRFPRSAISTTTGLPGPNAACDVILSELPRLLTVGVLCFQAQRYDLRVRS